MVICPLTQQIISQSFEEWLAQTTAEEEYRCDGIRNKEGNMIKENILSTPLLLAIQGVSRKERMAAMGYGMDSDLFKNGQVRLSLD